jgi:CHASE3 domain sensor protein
LLFVLKEDVRKFMVAHMCRRTKSGSSFIISLLLTGTALSVSLTRNSDSAKVHSEDEDIPTKIKP